MSHDRYTMTPEEKEIRELKAQAQRDYARIHELVQEVAKLEGQITNLRSTIEAWNNAEIMKCGCKYNKVWGGTKWEHWLVYCKEHAQTKEKADRYDTNRDHSI